MIFLCSRAPLATPFLSSGGLNGGVVITAPFVITGGGYTMSSLSITDSLSLYAVLSESGVVNIYTPHTETTHNFAEIVSSLSGMDNETMTNSISPPLCIDSCITISNDTSEGLTSVVAIANTIGDFGVSANLQVCTPINRTDYTGSIQIPLPNSTAKVISDNLKIYGDDRDITSKLVRAEINLFGGNSAMSCIADFHYLLSIPDKLTIDINGILYKFVTVSATSSGKHISITAEAETDNTSVAVNYDYKRASEMAAYFGDIIFSVADFITSGIKGQFSHFEFASFLAEMSGAYARLLPDGRSMIFSRNKDNPYYSPEDILSWETIYKKPVYSSIEVTYGKSGDDYITLEPSIKRTKAGQLITLKVYGAERKKPNINTGTLKLIKSSTAETITEDIFFEDGTGRLTKPASKMITAGITVKGKKVTCDLTCHMVTVTYQTICDTYEISSNIASDVTLCAYIENIAVIITGKSGATKRVSAPHICDYVTAIRLAKSYLDSDCRTMTLTTPHNNILNTTSGLNVNTPYGSGSIYGAKINIENYPVKITDRLEVLQWQR